MEARVACRCLIVAAAVASGCATTHGPAPVGSGMERPPLSYWDTVACDAVVSRFQDDCATEHRNIGLDPGETSGTRGHLEAAATEAAVARIIPTPSLRVMPTTEQTAAAKPAIDRALASSLKDPLSAMQYSVSDAVRCDDLLQIQSTGPQPFCACYMVNSKNSYGGYTGAQPGVVQLIFSDDAVIAMPTPSELISPLSFGRCFDANMAERDAGLIKAAVH
jgi:hypothetical protein